MTLPALVLAVSLASVSDCLAQEHGRISDQEIAALRRDLTRAGKATSSTRMRRAYKNVVRDGERLLRASSVAPNQWRVLEVIFQSQKRLLSVDGSDRNREALLETCGKLVEAPDELAGVRLEADMLLSERRLSLENADVKQRAQALAELVARYRETPAEARCLMIAAVIAPKLDAFGLEKEIQRALDERFAGDLDVIEWRRKHRDFSHLPVQFAGTFARNDGTLLSFPVDRLGQTYMVFFWSKETPEIEQRLDEVKDLSTRFPGWFEVYSFNLDDLPDAGEEFLRTRGLDWTVLRLPGGRQTQFYRAYAGKDPLVVRVNAHGHAHVSASQTRTLSEETPMEQNLDDPRYLAQMQSLLVGDFLVAGADSGGRPVATAQSVPVATLDAIQACFVQPPRRFRLTRAAGLANYEKAAELCRNAIAQYPRAPDLWRVRNRLIIALMGRWKLAAEPRHLDEAVAESQSVLDGALPPGANLVARFCLAKAALRRGGSRPLVVLSELIEATGGDDAPASAHGAAAVLAMDANGRALHAQYREKVLERQGSDPALWPTVSFLLDQNHTYRLFKPNFYHLPSRARRIERGALRHNAASLGVQVDSGDVLKAEFETLDGGTLRVPRGQTGKLTLLMFVEPPADPAADFPAIINGAVTRDSRGREVVTEGVMQAAFGFADRHVHRGLEVVTAFLSDDVARVKGLVEKHRWPHQVVMVPGGLDNPVVRRLGVLSADRVPNVVLLRPDGTIPWRISGILHPQLRSEGINETIHVIRRAIRANIEGHEIERSFGALENGDLREALRLFSGPFPMESHESWTAPRLHGRVVAHMGLKNWEAALTDIDAAIVSHQRAFRGKKQCTCQRRTRLLLTKATVLERMGRSQDAAQARQQAADPKTSHGPTRYGRMHDRLEALNKKRTRETP